MDLEGLSEEELLALKTPADRPMERVAQPSVEAESTASPQLAALHQDFAAAISVLLADYTKRDVDVQLRDQSKGTFAQFVFGQPIPTCCCVVQARAIDVEFYVAWQPTLLYPLIDQMLGSSEHDPIPQRPLTEVERGLVDVIVQGLMDKYEDAWREVLSLDLAMTGIEHNIQQQRMLPGGEATYRVRYAVRFGGHAGMLEFCLPWEATQQLRQRLAKQKGS